MRIIAYYQLLTVPLMRRIVAPFSVLSQRGEQTVFNYLASVEQLKQAQYDLVLLPNYLSLEALPPIAGQYVYDLTDAALLTHDACVQTLSQCSGVLCATDAIAKRVKAFNPRVVVAPSSTHSEWLFAVPAGTSALPLLACLGLFDFAPYVAALRQVLQQVPQLRILTDSTTLLNELPSGRIEGVAPDINSYPGIIRAADVAFAPGLERLTDPGMLYDYQLAGIPIVAGPAWAAEITDRRGQRAGRVAHSPEAVTAQLTLLLTRPSVRSQLGARAQANGRAHSATLQADAWLTRVRKLCPTARALATLR